MARIGASTKLFESRSVRWPRHEIARMTVLNDSGNEPLPGTVFTPRQVRVLKIAVIVMGLLLVGGFAFVLAAIVYQASRGGQGEAVSAEAVPAAVLDGVEAELAIGKDGSVTGLALDGDRLALHLNSASGPEIVVIDLATGKVVARVRLKAE
jgi:hypothetical protein